MSDRVAIVVIDRPDGTRVAFVADGPRVTFPPGFALAPGDRVRAGEGEVRDIATGILAASSTPARSRGGIVRP